MAPVPNMLGFGWALKMGILTKHIFQIKPKNLNSDSSFLFKH